MAEHPSSGAIGGAEVAMSILAEQLVKEGVGVHYASMRPPETGTQDIHHHPASSRLGRTVYDILNRHSTLRRTGRWMLALARGGGKFGSFVDKLYIQEYESALADADADVYIQVSAGRQTAYLADFCEKKRRPFIFRSTSLWDADLTFKWGFTSWRESTKALYLRGVKRADIVAANSVDTANAFKKHIDRDKVLFVPDGFHIPPCSSFSREEGYVLWVGRDAPYKRSWLYPELARMLPKHEFVMVGDLNRIGNPPPNLRLLGPKKPSELPEIYSRAKVLVNTSEVEGFPNVLVEAGMRGVPYVGFIDPDGVVTEQSLGFRCEHLNDMAIKIDLLMKEEDLRLKLGKNARQFVEENRDIEKVVKIWLALLDGLVHRDARA